MFRSTLEVMGSESGSRSLWVLGLTLSLLCGWLYWFVCVPVTIYVSSTSARVEVLDRAYTVDLPRTGKVVSVHRLELGRYVQEGEVLLVLDASQLEEELEQARAREEGFAPQIAAAGREIEAQASAIEALEQRRVAESERADSRRLQLQLELKLAREALERARQLNEAGAFPRVRLARTDAEVTRLSAALQELEAAARSAESEALEQVAAHRARVAELDGARAALRSSARVETARIRALEKRIAQYQVRAPAAGRVGTLGELRVGSVLKEGDRVATLIRTDAMRVTAQFEPAKVFGRIQSGSRGRVEFQGFPWVEYGRPGATVSRVAGDVVNGLARVELELDPADITRIPLQHGQPARVAIAIERSTPLLFVLRWIG